MAAPRLGLSMIVKDAADTLRNCLESVRGLVDEMVVVDTGSTDSSPEIARQCGAVCLSIPWTNDFAQARNVALTHSTTDWVLSLDADEELDAQALKVIPSLLSRTAVGGYIVPVRNYLPARHGSVNGNRAASNDGRCASAKDAPAYAQHLVVRLFRRHPKIVYKGCVHENIAPQIIAAGFRLANADFCIHHLGFLARSRYGKKAELYLELLKKKVEQEPENPLAWLELARQLHEPFHKNEEALGYLKRALTLDPKLGAANFLAGVVCLDMGLDQEALSCLDGCQGGEEYAIEREHARGDALHNLGRLEEAQSAYKMGLQLAGHDPQMESKLGYVQARLGEQAGFQRMQDAIAALPLGAELHERLIKAYLAAGMLPEAATAAENFASTLVHPKTILRAAAIRAHLKQDEQARKLIERGLEFFPQSTELHQVRAELAARAYAASTNQ
jgi:tetratricopeptide (TPR) repeat protein